jgi:hypothetical protein
MRIDKEPPFSPTFLSNAPSGLKTQSVYVFVRPVLCSVFCSSNTPRYVYVYECSRLSAPGAAPPLPRATSTNHSQESFAQREEKPASHWSDLYWAERGGGKEADKWLPNPPTSQIDVKNGRVALHFWEMGKAPK